MWRRYDDGLTYDYHPNSSIGAGGPGRFRSARVSGADEDFDSWFNPGPITCCASDGSIGTAAGAAPVTDPAIEALNLNTVARAAAYELKKQFPDIVFTSGRRNKADQARAMASNVVLNRQWIKQTYAASDASAACQKWVDAHPEATTKQLIADGLVSVLDGLTDQQLTHLSKHLSGDAWDVQPVEKDAEAIKTAIRALHGMSKFLDKEGGLVRWHAQF